MEMVLMWEIVVVAESLKYDRGMVMELEGGGDVRMFMKGNDEPGYLYVGESNGLKRRTQKAMRTCEEGVVCVRSGRDRDDIVQQGRNGASVKRWVKCEYWAAVRGSSRCSDDHPQTRVRVGGKIIEMSDDDEILVTSKDIGEDEAAVQGGDESSQEKLGKKMDKHKQETMKWKNRVGKRIEQKLVDTYQKTGQVVGGDKLDDDYDRCILPLTNGRQPGRPPSKRRESQTQGTRSQRCSKCGEGGHTRRTYRNPRANFDANYKGDIVEVEALLDGSYVPAVSTPPALFVCEVEFLMFPAVRQPEMFTREEANVNRGGVSYSAMFTQDEANIHYRKPWCASGTLMGN
ncbi:hypothetical protein Cgig2_006582 [Carnegiea gigantea]|uniref:Uncharacterized protein n=1 Tax=Carnegiea gigantea TaxID=171969 RepID=A0A9Q1QM79_9CARY|nr:hypothetical protein Cgig2_006582 [Carnegiea gigantea]